MVTKNTSAANELAQTWGCERAETHSSEGRQAAALTTTRGVGMARDGEKRKTSRQGSLG